jgi:hypothetical protein
MAIYFAVFDQQESGYPIPTEPKFAECEVLTPIEMCKTVKLEAPNTTQAKIALEHFFGGDIAHKMTLVTEAQWVEGS